MRERGRFAHADMASLALDSTVLGPGRGDGVCDDGHGRDGGGGVWRGVGGEGEGLVNEDADKVLFLFFTRSFVLLALAFAREHARVHVR